MSPEQKAQCKRCVRIPTTLSGECIQYRRNELTLLCYSFLEKEEPAAPGPVFRDSTTAVISDGSTASYYELPTGATELQDLISYRNMNAQIGEIFRACYRYGQAAHSDQLRDAKKIMFYAKAEVERLEAIRKRPHRSLNVDGLAEYTTGTGRNPTMHIEEREERVNPRPTPGAILTKKLKIAAENGGYLLVRDSQRVYSLREISTGKLLLQTIDKSLVKYLLELFQQAKNWTAAAALSAIAKLRRLK